MSLCVCGNQIKSSGKKFCSHECYSKSLIVPKVLFTCNHCQAERLIRPCEAKRLKGYCKKCFPEYCKTIKETRKKPQRRITTYGIKKCEVCEKEFEYKVNQKRNKKTCGIECGRKLSVIALNGISNEIRKAAAVKRSSSEKWKRYVISITGENNKRFKGTKRNRNENYLLKAWRKNVFMRDFYTCQHCQQKSGKLEAHHIKEWAKHPDLRYDISNGITLCYDCHNKVHGKTKKEKTYHCISCGCLKTNCRRKMCKSCGAKNRVVNEEKKQNI